MIRDESKEDLSAKMALTLSAGILFFFHFLHVRISAGARLIYTVTDFIRCIYLTHQKLQILLLSSLKIYHNKGQF